VEQRFEQGVIRVPHYGRISRLTLPPVSAKLLAEVVAARVKPLLMECCEFEKPDVSPIFPFQEEDLAKSARSDGDVPPLRYALQWLHDRYDELISGVKGGSEPWHKPGVTKPTPPTAVVLEQMEAWWQREQRTAKRQLDGPLATLSDDLHAGIARWLECLIAEGVSTESGKPTSVSNLAVGTHPTYGQITKCEWSSGSERCQVGVGLLLGERRGMSYDLETKLKMIAATPSPVEVLILLWPKGTDLKPPFHEHFPEATRAIWNQYDQTGTTRRVQLRAVAREDFAPWLALSPWLNAISTEAKEVTRDIVNHFLAERTVSLLKLVDPRS
jgi:hypothetical protein